MTVVWQDSGSGLEKSAQTRHEEFGMPLEEALQAQEEKVDALLKGATRYVSALKGWK
jgi:hypothetical protein